MIESPSLKKISMQAQLTELSEDMLFLWILGPSGLAQGLHEPNSCTFLISGIRQILLDLKTIMVKFFCGSNICQSLTIQVKPKKIFEKNLVF